MTDWIPRTELDLSFIGNGNESFADGINADRAARDFRKTVSELPQDRRLKIRMAPGGGYAARIYDDKPACPQRQRPAQAAAFSLRAIRPAMPCKAGNRRRSRAKAPACDDNMKRISYLCRRY